AFLGEVEFVEVGEEHRVEVDLEQVVEVLAVLAGEGVGRPVAAGEGVHEGVHRTPDHHEEGVAHREAAAAAQRRMLEEVRHAGGVHRHGAQRHRKDVLGVVAGQVEVHGAGAQVLVFLHGNVQRGQVTAAAEHEGRAAGYGRGGRGLGT